MRVVDSGGSAENDSLAAASGSSDGRVAHVASPYATMASKVSYILPSGPTVLKPQYRALEDCICCILIIQVP